MATEPGSRGDGSRRPRPSGHTSRSSSGSGSSGGRRPGKPSERGRGTSGRASTGRGAGTHGGGRPSGRKGGESTVRDVAGRPTSAPRRTGRAPEIPVGTDPATLDPDVRRQLRTLPKGLAEEVAGRLVATRDLLESDPEAAHLHATEAARIASRVAPAREALGVTSYATGRWAQARSELRAARRLSGSDEYLPMIADCERGLGKPERALDIAGSPEAARLDRAGRVEMRIVASGARRDLGQLDAAVLTLQTSELREATHEWSGRLRYAYADALLAAGRTQDAVHWFERALEADRDGLTEAGERLAELAGGLVVDVTDESGSDDEGPSDADSRDADSREADSGEADSGDGGT